MCIFNMVSSTLWAFYGHLRDDKFIILPNAIGMILAIIQLSLFLIYPSKAKHYDRVDDIPV